MISYTRVGPEGVLPRGIEDVDVIAIQLRSLPPDLQGALVSALGPTWL